MNSLEPGIGASTGYGPILSLRPEPTRNARLEAGMQRADLPILSEQVPGGRHFRVAKDTPMNNFFLLMLDRMGVDTEQFGDSTGRRQLPSV